MWKIQDECLEIENTLISDYRQNWEMSTAVWICLRSSYPTKMVGVYCTTEPKVSVSSDLLSCDICVLVLLTVCRSPSWIIQFSHYSHWIAGPRKHAFTVKSRSNLVHTDWYRCVSVVSSSLEWCDHFWFGRTVSSLVYRKSWNTKTYSCNVWHCVYKWVS